MSRSRRGLTQIELVLAFVVLFVAAAVLLPQFQSARTPSRGNTCRSNMRAVATAIFQYQIDHGKFPGYMNVLQRDDGSAFVDPETGVVTPVSWAVMIFPYIDRRPTFDQWRKDWSSAANRDGAAKFTRFFTDQYIELFLCMSDPQQTKTGTPLSYVVNTGLPDRPTATVDMPRDWAANGMLFDNYSEHELVKTSGPRGPMEYMTDDRIKDPHAMTILLTENLDATSYVFRNATHAAENWKACEVTTGCIWRPGPIDKTKTPPAMAPPVESLRINGAKGLGNGTDYNTCRPSSNHPGGVNVAFVGQNVSMLRDTIDYFVYAKLMATDDANAGDGSLDPIFGTYELKECDLSP